MYVAAILFTEDTVSLQSSTASGFYSLSPLSSTMVPMDRKIRCDAHSRDEYSAVLYSVPRQVVEFFVNHHQLYTEGSLIKVERYVNLWI